MRNRRLFLAILGVAALVGAKTCAFEIRPYSKDVADGAIASGKPVIIEVYASWCPICLAQASAVDAMKNESAYRDLAFFRVDYDKQKDVVRMLKSPRATFILYRGGKEIMRESWRATPEDVARILMKATK